MLATRDTFPLIAELLAEQQRLDTPVARFAAAHERAIGGGRTTVGFADAGDLDERRLADETLSGSRRTQRSALPVDGDLRETGRTGVAFTSQLIPLSAPNPGEQYAFEVDLDSCSGCKSCVAACHALNGLDEDETWRDVGLLVSDDRRHPYAQTITTACHHCADPACLNGCPVLAYEKDPVTGIVRHLDDQCIGCSYCILKCPYDVPKYSARLGIVRKCDMCHGRLAHGEAPACAQACPTQAIRITIVATAAVRSAGNWRPETGNRNEVGEGRIASTAGGYAEKPEPTAATLRFLPTAPDPSYTRPTTRYVCKRGIPPSVVAADAAALVPQPAHWPLVVLLLLMPMAVGCQVLDRITDVGTPAVALVSWIAGAGGLAASVAHLGQPRRAWRVFLGLRRSWLSREAFVFAVWFPLATLYTATRFGALNLSPTCAATVGTLTGVIGLIGLYCSAKIYADTQRDFWQMKHTAPRFYGSAVVLSLATALACCAVDRHSTFASRIAVALAAAVVAKLLFETQALEPLKGDRDQLTPALKTARLLTGPLRGANELRAACAVFGGIVLTTLVATNSGPAWLGWPALMTIAFGEFLERSLFFRAVVAPKMPGVPK